MCTRTRPLLRVAMALGVICVFLAGPATAATTGAGQSVGVAEVGKWFARPCDKNGEGDPDGKGLYSIGTVTVPGLSKGDDIRPEEGVWRLGTIGNYAGAIQSPEGDGPSPYVGPFIFQVCGYLSATIDPDRSERNTPGAVGASCETSKAHHGQGHILFLDPTNIQRIKLFNVGWKVSVGGTLPMYGQYQEYADDENHPSAAAKTAKFGTLVATLQFQGGAGCTGQNQPLTNNANGAQHFNMMAVMDFHNGGAVRPKEQLDPAAPFFGPKHCKRQGPNLPESPGEKKPKDKADAEPCTADQGGDKW